MPLILSPVTLKRVIADMREHLQREANQAILKRELDQGHLALGGIDALDRLERTLGIVFGSAWPLAVDTKLSVVRKK
jgi:hypothetical protein